ncbi:hypothetical protein [Acetobacterium wieringae]|uniref:hypothetical protein n=1 Tax=Acetobacterium wieringae TaxID=52694 RepID=UPI0026EF1707|nr:hypothetical protein [Acetobacterium wieringae]
MSKVKVFGCLLILRDFHQRINYFTNTKEQGMIESLNHHPRGAPVMINRMTFGIEKSEIAIIKAKAMTIVDLAIV